MHICLVIVVVYVFISTGHIYVSSVFMTVIDVVVDDTILDL